MKTFARRLTGNFLALTFVGAALLSIMLLSSSAIADAAALSEVPTLNTYVTNGPVDAMATGPDGTVYIGGEFSTVSRWTGSGAPINVATGDTRTAFPKVTGTINAVASDGAGGFFIGGDFTTVDASARNRLAHVKSDGTLDQFWNPGANSTVRAIKVYGTTVYVGGEFTTIAGVTRDRLAALSASTGAATTWDPGASDTVFALAVSSTTVYAGGKFTQAGGSNRKRLVAISRSAGTATSWNPNLNTGQVNALALSTTNVYVGGTFTRVGGTSRNYLAAISKDSGKATAWNPNPDSTVHAIAVSGSSVYAGGDFSSVGGQTRDSLARLSASTGQATSWNPSPNDTVRDIVVSGGYIYAAGDFTAVTLDAQRHLAKFNASTGAGETTWNAGLDDAVNAIAISGSVIYAGGQFTSAGAVWRYNIAAIDPATGQPTDWNPGANSWVYSLAVSGDTVYAGGNFATLGGQPRSRIGAIDADTGTATSWNPGANGDVYSISPAGGVVYAGGEFSTIGGASRNYLAALAVSASGDATSWDPNPTGIINALAVSGDTVYVAGNFFSVGGQLRQYLGAVNASSGAATSWNPRPGGRVYTIVPSNGAIFVGGGFSFFGDAPLFLTPPISASYAARQNIAAIDPSTGLANSWNPGANAIVSAIAITGDTLYAAGGFTVFGGTNRDGVAAIGKSSGVLSGWNPRISGGGVSDLALSGGSVFVGGPFISAANTSRRYFAQYDWDASAPDTVFNASLTSSYGWYKAAPKIGFSTDERATTQSQWGATLDSGWNTYTAPFTAPVAQKQSIYYRSIDLAGNTEDIQTRLVKIDSGLPTVAFGSTAPKAGAYIKGTKTFTAPASDGVSGISSVALLNGSTLISRDYSWTFNFTLRTTALSNGPHAIRLRASDLAGNLKTVSRTMNIDNYKPRTRAPYRATVSRNSWTKLYYKILDPYSPTAKVKIVIKKSSGTKVKTLWPGWKGTGTLRYAPYQATLSKGTYYFHIYATDKAGNAQYTIARNKLVIN